MANATVDLTIKTGSVASTLDGVTRQTRGAMASMRAEVKESNASLAIMGETIGVGIPRHIRTFISEIPGVSKAMSVAFDGIAVVLLIKVLVEVAEKAKKVAEAFHEVGESNKKIGEGFAKINEPIEASNHQLELSIIKTENAIAKLEHKPQNLLAQALAEAAVKADELSHKLRSAFEESRKLLEQENHGFFMRLITQTSGTQQSQDIYAWAAEQERGLQHDENYDANVRAIAKEMWNRAQIALNQNKTAAAGEIDPTTGVRVKSATDYGTPNRALYELQTNTSNIYRGMDLSDTDTSKKEELQGDQDKNAARRKGLEDSKKLDEQERQRIETRLKTLADARQRLAFLLTVRGRPGNESWLTGERGELIAEGQRAYAHANPQTMPWTMPVASDQATRPSPVSQLPLNMLGKDEALTETLRKATEQLQKSEEIAERAGAKQIEDISKRAALAVKSVDWESQTGQISRHAAALALLGIHTDEYTQKISKLREQEQELRYEREAMLNAHSLHHDGLNDEEFKNRLASNQEKLDANQDAQGEATSGFQLQHAEDLWNTQAQTAQRGMQEFWQECIAQSQNAAAMVKSSMTEAIDGINHSLVEGMLGKKMDWGKTFEGMASHTLTSSLKMGEGMIANHLGLGKRGDTPMTPLYTQDVSGGFGAGIDGFNGLSGSNGGSGIGGFLHKLFSFIPGFAGGGDADAGIRVVGENGPELETGPAAHITNNTDLRTMLSGGGGQTMHIGYIDARGTNAADVEMRIHRIARQYSMQGAQAAMQAQKERSARRPRSS